MASDLESYSYAACGKAILLGEHFVVHDVSALAIPLTCVGTTVTVTPLATSQQSRWLDPTLSPAEAELAARLLDHARARLGATTPLAVRTDSTIPRGCGLGSSASLAVALCGAVAQVEGKALGRDALRSHAHALEGLIHGAPSGIDDATIAWAKPLCFRRGAEPEPLNSSADLTVVLASSGRPAPTREAVAQVAALGKAAPTRFRELCEAAAEQVSLGKTALQEGDSAQLGKALNATHQLLAALGVSTPALDRLVETARSAGAWGAKLTGAGLGGFMLALVDPEQANAVSRALRADGAEHILVSVVPATALVDAQQEGSAA